MVVCLLLCDSTAATAVSSLCLMSAGICSSSTMSCLKDTLMNQWERKKTDNYVLKEMQKNAPSSYHKNDNKPSTNIPS